MGLIGSCVCGGGWGCREAHNPRAIVIKKEGGGGRRRVSDQQNKALSLQPPYQLIASLREAATKKDISINWEVWFSDFPRLAKQTGQSRSKQLLRKCVSVPAGCLSAWRKCHRTITDNHSLSSPIISKGHIYIKKPRIRNFSLEPEGFLKTVHDQKQDRHLF